MLSSPEAVKQSTDEAHCLVLLPPESSEYRAFVTQLQSVRESLSLQLVCPSDDATQELLQNSAWVQANDIIGSEGIVILQIASSSLSCPQLMALSHLLGSHMKSTFHIVAILGESPIPDEYSVLSTLLSFCSAGKMYLLSPHIIQDKQAIMSEYQRFHHDSDVEDRILDGTTRIPTWSLSSDFLLITQLISPLTSKLRKQFGWPKMLPIDAQVCLCGVNPNNEWECVESTKNWVNIWTPKSGNSLQTHEMDDSINEVDKGAVTIISSLRRLGS